MVDQDGERIELRNEYAAGGHNRAGAVQKAFWLRLYEMKTAAAIEQCAVYSAPVWGVEMYDCVIELMKGCGMDQPFQHEPVAYLHKGNGVRQAALALGDQKDGFGHGVALCVEPACRMAPGSVGTVIEEVFCVPAHDKKAVAGLREQRGEKYHSKFHTANMTKNS